MTVPLYITQSTKVTDRPCILHSIIVGNNSSSEGYVNVYNARSVDAPHKIAQLSGDEETTKQYSWSGLKLDRGLYVEFDANIDWVTVEWEPLKCSS